MYKDSIEWILITWEQCGIRHKVSTRIVPVEYGRNQRDSDLLQESTAPWAFRVVLWLWALIHLFEGQNEQNDLCVFAFDGSDKHVAEEVGSWKIRI